MRQKATVKKDIFYVYTLASPNGEVFYMGKGSGNRIDAHEKHAKKSDLEIQERNFNLRKCTAIREVWSLGGQIQKQIVYETFVEGNAFIYEWALINMVYGVETLTNILSCVEVNSTRVRMPNCS